MAREAQVQEGSGRSRPSHRSGWCQQQQAQTSPLPLTPPSSVRGSQTPTHHRGGSGKTQQKKQTRQFHGERHKEPLAKG